jgi:predicted ArsR family transcriptional regulator
VQELCAQWGVTATAVRQRLNRLQTLGFVTRTQERIGRGRPHHRYRLSETGLKELGDNYAELAVILFREMQEFPDPAVRTQLRQRVRDALASRFRTTPAEPLPERLQKFRDELEERGYRVDVDFSRELPVLREHNCPYTDLANEDRGICELEQGVFERVLGVGMKLTRCCQDDQPCCEFSITPG